MLAKKTPFYGRNLDSNKPFQQIRYSVLLSSFNSKILNKQISKTFTNKKMFHIFSCSAFNSSFVANVAGFMLNSEFFTRLEILDLLTNRFLYLCIKYATPKFIIIRSSKVFFHNF